MVENPEEIKKITVKASNLHEFLGPEKIIPEKLAENDEIGVVNGLAYTDAGGDMLKVEVISMPGTGKVELTGSLGDVMKESARIAVSIVRQRAEKLGIDPDFYKTKDIHIHFPEGAVPKDGPSAGVTLVTALISELGKYPARRDIAMTGEVSLRGKVIPIGGLREKSMAAYLAGVIKTLSLMKKSAILVNEARGAVVDESAVAKAIAKGSIAGFGCDVYSVEPFPKNHPYNEIMTMPNVILTPHAAWGAYEARERCVITIANNIQSFLDGKTSNRVDI